MAYHGGIRGDKGNYYTVARRTRQHNDPNKRNNTNQDKSRERGNLSTQEERGGSNKFMSSNLLNIEYANYWGSEGFAHVICGIALHAGTTIPQLFRLGSDQRHRVHAILRADRGFEIFCCHLCSAYPLPTHQHHRKSGRDNHSRRRPSVVTHLIKRCRW